MLSIVGNINCLIYISHGVCWTICELFISNILGFFSLVKNILGLFWCWRGSNMRVVAVYYCIPKCDFYLWVWSCWSSMIIATWMWVPLGKSLSCWHFDFAAAGTLWFLPFWSGWALPKAAHIHNILNSSSVNHLIPKPLYAFAMLQPDRLWRARSSECYRAGIFVLWSNMSDNIFSLKHIFSLRVLGYVLLFFKNWPISEINYFR